MHERDLFNDAQDIKDPTERAAFVDRQCGDDVRLAGRLRAMLEYQEGDDDLLSEERLQPQELDLTGIGVCEGATIGRYKLLEEVGEGGFGIVFMAEQTEPVQRTVALKVIKPGMDTRQVIARFEAERQSLAVLDHPHIARVLDGGTTDNGRPYFVMELVDGIPITKFCDQNRLNTTERLKLFMKVCQAIQHAHQRGIIHRDIKPSNVLVAQDGDEAIPRVIDFGVAKAIGEDPGAETRFTRQGQVIGTPQYMSPEQADRNMLDVDTRSDVYSLGILLYELLTGSTPLDKERLKSAPRDELCRLVREQETATPSSKISTLGETAEMISQNRSTDPDRLRQLLRRELDWITLRALQKERERRYESPSAIVEDIERFLDGQPVVAGPPGTMYRVRKFVRRNRVLVFAAVAVAASLLLGFTTTLLTLGELSRTVSNLKASRDDVVSQAEIAKSNLELTAGMLMSVERDPNVTVLDMLDEFVSSDLPTRLEGERPEVRADHRLLIGNLYARLGEQDFAQQLFLDAVEDRREHGDQLLLADALTDLAENSMYCCHYSTSHEAANEAAELLEAAAPPYAQHARSLAESANTFLEMIAGVSQATAEYDHQEKAKAIKQQLEADPELRPAGVVNSLLVMLFLDVEDFEFAEKVCLMQPMRYDSGHGESATDEVPALFANGKTLREFGLGFLATQQGKHDEAQEHYGIVLQQMRKFPVRNRDNQWVEALYAWALIYQDKPSDKEILEAERRSQITVNRYKQKPNVLPALAVIAYHSNALAKFRRGYVKSAIETQKIALERCRHSPRHLLLQLVVEEQLANYHLEDGDPKRAKEIAGKAVDWRSKKLNQDHPNRIRANKTLEKYKYLAE